MRKYAGADWLERQKKPMSDFGRTVADLVGDVALGIYHWQDSVMAADWFGPRSVILKGRWAERDYIFDKPNDVICSLPAN